MYPEELFGLILLVDVAGYFRISFEDGSKIDEFDDIQ
jgi:hypothetical protein